MMIDKNMSQARNQPSDNRVRFPQILYLFTVWKLGFPVAVYEKPQFLKKNNDWWRYVMVKARIYMVSLLAFINSTSQTDNMQDVSARTVGEKWTF